jgi:transcription termination factor Rho
MDKGDAPKGDGGGKPSDNRKDWRKKRRGRGRRRKSGGGPKPEGGPKPDGGQASAAGGELQAVPEGQQAQPKPQQTKSRRGGRNQGQKKGGGREKGHQEKREPLGTTEGLILIDKQKHGDLRATDRGWLKTNQDVHVVPRLVEKYKLKEGSLIKGPYIKGHGRAKFDLLDVETVDGLPPEEAGKFRPFKSFTSIAPDFHYNVGDLSGDLSLRIIDLLAPVGRGQRGLLVAPPRSGKTMILQAFAKALEEHFPDVHLMVLLIDERPEEATEWRRSIDPSQVFVSTNDETAKKHTQLCEAVFKRAKRLVEMGEEVFLLVDSLTRMGRAYNNVKGNSGKTMSGGIDSRALEIPKQFFGLARNTETAGSLTILATALIETGSQMDRVIFEEFKGTGNMELVLSRKLADRRIFPAIDIERSGTRKEERLFSLAKLRQMHTLRRVLTRMHFAEAMELLVTKLDEVPTNADFLKRFEVDPEA